MDSDVDLLDVAPVVADLTAPPWGDPAEAQRLRTLLSGATRWAVSTFLPTAGVRDGRLVDRDPNATAGAVIGIAVGLRTGAFDETVDQDEARDAAVTAVGGIAASHRANGGVWGGEWVGSLGAGLSAMGAWLLWDELDEGVQQQVARYVADEATFRYGVPTRYLRDVAGAYLTEGDTGAEEESWNVRGMAAAVAMLPGHAQAQRWSRSLVLRMLASFSKPSEVDDRAIVQGTPVCSWLAGSNMEENGDLQNHGFNPNPNYMRPPHNVAGLMLLQLGGHPVPDVATHGLRDLYLAHQRHYREDGTLNYPAGTDFQARNVILYANDVQMAAYDVDRANALRWQEIHGRIAEAALLPDGRVQEAQGSFYNETDVLAKLGEAYLALVLAPQPRTPWVELMGAPPQGRATACEVGTRTFSDTSGEQAVAARWTDATGVLPGRPDGTFGAREPMTRMEAVRTLHRVAGSPLLDGPRPFADVTADGGEGDLALRWAAAGGLTVGRTPTTFAPDEPVTRGQALLMLWRARGRPRAPLPPFRDVSGETAQAVGWAVSVGITKGQSPEAFGPGAVVTRGQFAQWIHRQLASG